MHDLTVPRVHLDRAALAGQPVTADGLVPVLPGTLVRTPDGAPRLAYVSLWDTGDDLLERLRAALLTVKVARTYRASAGTWQNSAYFGSMPRQRGTTHDYCRAGEVDGASPAAAALLYEVGANLELAYRALAPGVFAHHAVQADRIGADWKPGGLRCFTGGVVNRDNPITWHTDRGNFAGTWSAMPVVRAGMDGGWLAVPELGLAVPCADGTAVLFDGQSLLHGVTPMRRTQRTGHRFSVVYYAVRSLWECLPPQDEVARMQVSRTERELRRASGGRALLDAQQRARLDTGGAPLVTPTQRRGSAR